MSNETADQKWLKALAGKNAGKAATSHLEIEAKASRKNKLCVKRILPLKLRRTSNCSIKLCSTYFGSMPTRIQPPAGAWITLVIDAAKVAPQ